MKAALVRRALACIALAGAAYLGHIDGYIHGYADGTVGLVAEWWLSARGGWL